MEHTVRHYPVDKGEKEATKLVVADPDILLLHLVVPVKVAGNLCN
jgi:hypothetical protein